ncbi:MAG TPA: 30S ribosomal protein S8 [Coxiellaceae bacterium]|nr:30S ribosomal protein S8 [Coxiellaceae bacterium]
MSMTDPISDMFTRIRNAGQMNKAIVEMPYSKQKEALASVLKEEGYINEFEKIELNGHPGLKIVLKYYKEAHVIESIRRVSKPGLRRYVKTRLLPRVRNGLGIAIVSTTKGLMTDRAARAQGLGGEIIGEVS